MIEINFTDTHILPADFRKRLRDHAMSRNETKIEDYIELRDFIFENEDDIKAYGIQRFYEDVAKEMICSWHTVDKNLDIIGNFPDAKLRYWIKNKLGFNHMETAKELGKDSTFHPDQILDAAVQLGNGNGDAMTVDEMTAFVLGGEVRKPKSFSFVKTLSTWLRTIPLAFTEWEASKVSRVTAKIEDLMQELQS